MDQKLQDQTISHNVLNYAQAAYHGRVAWLETLSVLGHPAAKSAFLGQVRAELEEICGWLDRLWDGETLFEEQRGERQSADAQKALEYLRVLQPELAALAAEIQSVLDAGELPKEHNNTIFLAAAYCRAITGEQRYADSFVQFGTIFNDSNLSGAWKVRAAESREMMNLANEFIDFLKQPGEVSEHFFKHLEFSARILPGTFRAQVHDIAQLLQFLRGPLTYDRLGFLKPEASVWDRAGIDPVEAGYWRAYQFDKDDALEWSKVGIKEPMNAAKWKLAGFSSEEAVPWAAVQFSPLLAIQWYCANYQPQEAAMLVAKGYHHPSMITPEQAQDILSAKPDKPSAASGPVRPVPAPRSKPGK